MRHTFVKRITALMLAAALAVPVSAATQPVMEVQAATIRLADTSKAASVHQTLMNGKKVVITLNLSSTPGMLNIFLRYRGQNTR